jgi:hypothetical protein
MRLLLSIMAAVLLAALLGGCGTSSDQTALKDYVAAMHPILQSNTAAFHAGQAAIQTAKASHMAPRKLRPLLSIWAIDYRRTSALMREVRGPADLTGVQRRWADSIDAAADSLAHFESVISTLKVDHVRQLPVKQRNEIAALWLTNEATSNRMAKASSDWFRALKADANRLRLPEPSWWKDVNMEISPS